MSDNLKPTFSRWKFMLTAALSLGALWAVNAGAQAAVKAWRDSLDPGCLYCFDRAFDILGAELVIVVLNGVVLGVFAVRLIRQPTAGRWGMLAGFGGFVLVTAATLVVGSAAPPKAMKEVVMPAVSPIPAGSGKGQIAFVDPSGDIGLVDVGTGKFTSLGEGMSPAWSPDGSRLAYDAPCDKKKCIYVMTADGQFTRFVDDNATSDENPVWSPDGTKIAFVSDSIVCVMNADGSHSIQIGLGRWPAWSPDGRRIAFVRDADAQIYLANADGSDLTALTNRFVNWIDDLAWSPDGRQLAFIGDDNSLYVVNADGSNLRQLVTSTTGAPAWSPDGIYIAFASSAYTINLTNADGSGGKAALNLDSYPGLKASWSPDGTRIAFIQDRGILSSTTAHVCVVNADGTNNVCFGQAVDSTWPYWLAWRP